MGSHPCRLDGTGNFKAGEKVVIGTTRLAQVFRRTTDVQIQVFRGQEATVARRPHKDFLNALVQVETQSGQKAVILSQADLVSKSSRLICCSRTLAFSESCQVLVELRTPGGATISADTRGLILRDANESGDCLVKWSEGPASGFTCPVPVRFLAPVSEMSRGSNSLVLAHLWNSEGTDVANDSNVIEEATRTARKRKWNEAADYSENDLLSANTAACNQQ